MDETRYADFIDLAWIRTDAEGHIERLSPSATKLLGLSRAGGENLFMFFPVHGRQMEFDMEVALTGWPSRRMATLESSARRRLLVRYTVRTRGSGDASLYWCFDVIGVDTPERFH